MSEDASARKGGWTVTVYTGSILDKPLLHTDKANKVVLRTAAGSPSIVLVRIHDGAWGVSTAADDDWADVCKRYDVS